jgi:membrane associated rhomboid family serine protease
LARGGRWLSSVALVAAAILGATAAFEMAGLRGSVAWGVAVGAAVVVALTVWALLRRRRLQRKAAALQAELKRLEAQETALRVAEAKSTGAFDRFGDAT